MQVTANQNPAPFFAIYTLIDFHDATVELPACSMRRFISAWRRLFVSIVHCTQ
ncbi:hypothetical protein [Klebsiella pneumoniae ISC21]|nr:hypothetical protein [Klebsiella pneumoniae ISC21]